MRPFDDIGRIRAVEFKNKPGDRLTLAIGCREPLSRSPANANSSKIADPNRATVNGLDRRFFQVRDRVRQADPAHGELLCTYFDKLRPGGLVCAVEGANNIGDLQIVSNQQVGI